MAEGDTGQITDLKPIGEITDLKPIGQSTVQPKTEEGALGKLWDWANRGIVSKDTFVRAISGMTPEQLNYALASYPTESPVHAAIREFVRGSIQDVGSTASGLTSPLSLGTMAAGAAGKIPGAAGTVAKAITGASSAGFGAKGASDIYQAGTEGTPEAWQQRLQGGAMLTSGGAGTGEALKAVPKPGLQSAAERVYQSSLKPGPGSYSTGQVQSMVKTGLEQGIPISSQGIEKLTGLIGDLNDKVKAKIAAGQQAGQTVSPGAVVKPLQDVRTKFQQQVNPASDVAAIDQSQAEFFDTLRSTPGGAVRNMTPQEAQAVKVGTYRQLKGKYGELSSASVEAQKALARGIKEELETQFPEIKDLNAQEGKMIGLDGALERAVRRIENRNVLSLTGSIIAGGMGTMAGVVRGSAAEGAGAAMSALVLHHVLTDPTVQSKLAITLNHAAKTVPMSAARARVIGYANALGSSLPSNEQGTP